jgi:hypothetical protein
VDEPRKSALSRRAVLAGFGVAGGAALLGPAARVGAAPIAAGSSTRPRNAATPGGFTTIASTPEANVSYQFRTFYDFAPTDDWSVGRVWGGSGVYAKLGGTLITTFDAPPGTSLHDVEWYTANTAAATWGVSAWHAGFGTVVTPILLNGTIPAGSSAIAAHKFPIPSAVNGPFPHGTRFVAFMNTPSNGTVQVNGVRLGFNHGALNPVMFANPKRVYDSRSHSPLAGGATRTISVASNVPPVAQAAVFALSILNTNGKGALLVGAAGKTPSANAIEWARTGDRSTNTLTCDVSTSLQVAIRSAPGSGSTDFIIDLISYLV